MITQQPLAALDFVALDLEATGIAHGHDRIVEIGAVRFRIGTEGQVIPGPRFRTLVNPDRRIPEIVSRLTGIDDAMVADAPPLTEVWPAFVAFLGDTRALVGLAHSARSDLAYLVSETHRLGLGLPAIPFVCTLPMARRVFPNAPKYTLSKLAAHVGLVDLDDPDATFHRALADALHTRNFFGRCIDETEARTLRDMGVRAPVPHPTPAEFDVHVPDHLRLLEQAMLTAARVSVIYGAGSKGRVRRMMTPLAFFADRGVPYLRAWCHLDDIAKSFRCDRISGVQADLADCGEMR